MRNARDFVNEYRRKGYPDDRIRIIASMRPEPLRTEALKILDAESQPTQEVAAATSPVAGAAPPRAQEAAPRPEAPDAPAAAAQEAPVAAREEAAPPPAAPAPDAKVGKRDAAMARAERDKAVSELRKVSAELARARAEQARLHAESAEIPGLLERVGQLHSTLAEKETLLVQKERALSESESALSRERAEREAAAGRAQELAATLEGQAGRLKDLAALHEQMAGANAELAELRENAAQLKESVEAKCGHIAEIETDLSRTRDEAALLREQVGANERAVAELQDKLTAREAELGSLRSHFDREAADLKKRAEQEMWMIRRRLRRVHALAGLAGAVAACLILALTFLSVGKARQIAGLKTELASARERAEEPVITATAPRAPEPAPRPVSAQLPSVKQVSVVEAPRSLPLSLRTISEPPRVETPARSPAPPADPAPRAPRLVTHKVRKGDTLWIISRRYLGNGEEWRSIARENHISLVNPEIREGMTLKITLPASN